MREILIDDAVEKQLKKGGQGFRDRVTKLIKNIGEDPFSGFGKPERLKYSGQWSRRIDKKNRLIYEVTETTVRIIKVMGHYDDH